MNTSTNHAFADAAEDHTATQAVTAEREGQIPFDDAEKPEIEAHEYTKAQPTETVAYSEEAVKE